MKNLDWMAASAAQAIIAQTIGEKAPKKKSDEVENLITKTLGILQENGVYAALLYLYSRTDARNKPIAEKTREKLLSLTCQLLDLPELPATNADTALKFLTDKICQNLDTLLLVKQLWEQTLIYTRYGAKARSASALK